MLDEGDSLQSDCTRAMAVIKQDHHCVKHGLLYAEVLASVRRKTRKEALVRAANHLLDSLPGRFVPIDAQSTKVMRRMAVPLRGADLVYVGLALQYSAPLVTMDQEMLERAGSLVTVLLPQDLDS